MRVLVELLVLASAYDGPVYEDHPVPLGFETLQIDAKGVTPGEAACTLFKWRP